MPLRSVFSHFAISPESRRHREPDRQSSAEAPIGSPLITKWLDGRCYRQRGNLPIWLDNDRLEVTDGNRITGAEFAKIRKAIPPLGREPCASRGSMIQISPPATAFFSRRSRQRRESEGLACATRRLAAPLSRRAIGPPL